MLSPGILKRDEVLNLKRPAVCIMAGLMLLGIIGEVSAGSVTTELNIEATVRPRLDYRLLREPRAFKLTPAGIKKGYQDIDENTILSVTTNNTNGYIISVNCYGIDDVTSIVVTTDDGVSYVISPGGGVEIHIPYSRSTTEIKKLSYRFYLLPDAEQGFYPWPIIVTAYPM